MEKVMEALANVKTKFVAELARTEEFIKLIAQHGNSSCENVSENNSLLRLNSSAQDSLSVLCSLQSKLDLLIPQLPTAEVVKSANDDLESWKIEYKKLKAKLRDANLQARGNMRRTAITERELLLGTGKESTLRRQSLQTKVGMKSAAESITASLRRTRQLMVQEVERSSNTLVALGESTSTLGKTEAEYQSHHSLLWRTRNLLSSMRNQDIVDRVILAVGFFLFSCAVVYVITKRIGLMALQRKFVTALRVAGSLAPGQVGQMARRRDQIHAGEAHDEL